MYVRERVVKFKTVSCSTEDGNKKLNHQPLGCPQVLHRVEKVENENLVPGTDEFWYFITRVGCAQLKIEMGVQERRGAI